MQSQSYSLPIPTNYSRILMAPPFRDVLSNKNQIQKSVKSSDLKLTLPESQEAICRFFMELVKQSSPDSVLSEFKKLFTATITSNNSVSQLAINEIIKWNDEQTFINTFKRSIYILLNNWIFARKYQPAQDLVELLSNLAINCKKSPLDIWLNNFTNSQDYQEIKLFVSKYENRDKNHWKYRYTSYLLAPQYVNDKNSPEQRQAAIELAKQLQEKFKFDLAMYTARTHPSQFNNKRSQNPTALGDEALRLIKKVVAKRSFFGYANLANIFLSQTRNMKYKYFKQNLIKYLFFSIENKGLVETLKNKLDEKLVLTYETFHEEELNSALLLKTCNRVVEYLTMRISGEPSSLFVTLASQGNPLTLAIILLKILLICPPTRSNLEVCIARLIEYYEGYPQEECNWVINFLEVTRIILSIYTENVQYNLVNMEAANPPNQLVFDENTYRIFSQQFENNQ